MQYNKHNILKYNAVDTITKIQYNIINTIY